MSEQRTRWENSTYETTAEDFEFLLMEMGHKGWEPWDKAIVGDAIFVYFKRPLEE